MATPNIAISPHEEAAALIRNKPVVSKEVFNGLLPELKARAFVITGVEAFDVMQDVKDLLATLPAGGDWRDIKGQIEEEISPWFSPVGANRRAEILLRTHGFQAYAAANYRTLEESKDIFPFRQYVSSEDARVRPSHAALHEKILPADSPFWLTHTPPWEWGCRCDVIGLGEEEALQIRAEDMNKPPEARRFMEGLPLKSVEESGVLHLGNGLTYNVATPWEKGQGVGYQFEPGTLHMNLAALQARYDAETWADFRAWAETTEVETLGRTVWQWLTNPPKWQAKNQASPPQIPPLPDADEIETLTARPLRQADIFFPDPSGAVPIDDAEAEKMLAVVTKNVLVEIGQIEALSAPLRRRLSEAEKEIRGMNEEKIYVFEADGVFVYSDVGAADRVPLPPGIGENRICTHNYPKGRSFSVPDIAVASKEGVRMMRVVTNESLHVIQFGPRWPGREWDMFADPDFNGSLNAAAALSRLWQRQLGWSEDEFHIATSTLLWYRLALTGKVIYNRRPHSKP